MPRKFRGPALLVIIALLAVLTPGCSLLNREGTRHEKVGTTEVTAPVTGGEVTGEVLAASPAIDVIKPLAPPIKLEVNDGELNGEATLSTPVPADLPQGIKPEDVGYLAKVEPSGEWLWVGGDYHPDTRTVTLQTPHFSEWVLGATDPDQILKELEEINYKSAISKPLFETMYGDLPKLSCSKSKALPKKAADVKPLVDVFISDTLPPEVKACMGLDKESGQFELEILNPDAMPLRLDLPRGVKVKHELLGDEGFMQLAASHVREKVTDDVILYQESKLRFSVDPDQLSSEPVITGQVDMTTFLFNSTMWMSQVILRGRALERVEGRNDPDSIERAYEEYAYQVLEYGSKAECVRKYAAEAEDDDGKIDFQAFATKYQEEILLDCNDTVVDETASRMEKWVKQPLKRLVNVGSELIEWGADFVKASMAQARSEIEMFMYLGARSAGWVKTYKLRVKLTRDIHFEQALPTAGESVFEPPQYTGTGGYRRQEPNAEFYLEDMLPPDCTHGLVFSADWVKGGKIAIGEYSIGGDDAWFMLVPVNRGDDELKAETYMYGAKRRCYFDPANHAQGDLFRLATEKLGHTTLAYRFNSPTDVFYRKWAYSNGYLLVGTVGTSDDAQSQQLLEKAFKHAALRLDDSYLGTQFRQ